MFSFILCSVLDRNINFSFFVLCFSISFVVPLKYQCINDMMQLSLWFLFSIKLGNVGHSGLVNRKLTEEKLNDTLSREILAVLLLTRGVTFPGVSEDNLLFSFTNSSILPARLTI